jgi:hypothetical protein
MKIIIIWIVLLNCQLAQAQNWQEWTKQKKTQIKYLLQQIAANQIYIDYVQKGYGIARNGLTAIGNSKDGEFSLHRDFFGSLKKVNPKIKGYAKVVDIIAFQARIMKQCKSAVQHVREAGQFTPDEISHCQLVFDNLLEDCLQCIDELFLVITAGELEMKDDERLKRIDQLYTDMQSKFGFCSSFSNEMGLLSVQRMSERAEIKVTKLLNGVK